MAYDLKPFTLNLADLAYLLAQVNFVPLFDGATNGNGIVNFNPATMDAWDAHGNQIWYFATQTGSYKGVALTGANVGLLGSGFSQISAPEGIRDVAGVHNNLFGDQAFWGTVDVPFRRDIGADFNNYITSHSADLSVTLNSANHVIVHNLVTTATDLDFDLSSAVAAGIGANSADVSRIALNPAGTAIVITFTPSSTLASVTIDLTANTVLDSLAATTYADAVNGHTTLTETAAHITTTALHTGTTASIVVDYNTTVDTNGVVHQGNVADGTPRMISRTITTGGVNLLLDSSNHFVAWDHLKYEAASIALPVNATAEEIAAHDAAVAYKTLIDNSGVVPQPIPGYPGEYANLVDGAKIVVPPTAGLTLLWDATANSASITYATLLTYIAGGSSLVGGPNGEALVDGAPLYKDVYNVNTNSHTYQALAGLTFDALLFSYHSLVVASGVNTATLNAGDPLPVDAADIAAAISSMAGIGAVAPAVMSGILSPDPTVGNGYGLLETLGHIDFQNPNSGEYFIGSENPGVAPVNSWFGIFGQFFDHGLDLIGKGGQGTKITITLDPTDPLYRAPGTDGPLDPGNTKITVGRATVAGADANGDPNYVNHTSPFIDQSQTYGSSDQITSLLRKWVSTDNNASFHAGIELFDGTTLEDSWQRRWPDGTTQDVYDTLPTLNELRDHVIDTNRAALTWEDVSDFRNRGANGELTSGNSGHALILDMNPRFDLAHLNPNDANGDTNWDNLVTGAVNQAIVALNQSGVRNAGTGTTDLLGFTGDQLSLTLGSDLPVGPSQTLSAGTVLTGASALIAAGWVNPADFSITLPAGPLHNAVGEILMAAVGDHYVAGDGRVNENFGLTSIHHVFHEEHNYQVENLKSWIYKHDAANPGTADAHEQLHNWQNNTGTTDLAGNYLNADNSIAWNVDKMFNATKLLVEMEYQHAAVDQYARTVTPRIQEFVGYSTGVDPTVSLEYSQVAFRFGHSTIRETIDTLDPSGWMMGHVTRYALEAAFLTPQTFAKEGVAAITLGLSRQQMNEVDEFITPALNQGLLGQPLDLAAINIARSRDLGIPTLNDFRAGISLAKYVSWDDFGKNMIHPESLVNFIAAYSFGGDVAKAQCVLDVANGGLDNGAFGTSGPISLSDALAFVNNSGTCTVAELNSGRSGFDHIDAWIGGLAEAHVPGGLLGETFDAVFVAQIQSLMDGDRFYYLYRLFGTNIHEEVNNGQFKDIVERNTGLSHLNGSIFAYADKYYDFARGTDGTLTDLTGDWQNHRYADILNAPANTKGVFSDGGDSVAANGATVLITGNDGIRGPVNLTLVNDRRVDANPDQVHTVEGTPTDGADSHEVIVATDNADYIHGRGGDDTLYGEGGDDFLFGDGGVDRVYGGAGNDMIDTGEGPDLADGGAGKDIIYGRGSGSEVGGFDQLVGGSGNDLVIGGEGIDKLSGGSGDDIIYGDGLTNPEMGNTDPFTHAGDGNDYVDGGASGDLLYGEEGDDYLVGGNDQDLIQGGAGDDIIRPGNPSQAIGGGPDEVIGDDGYTNSGFDLVDFSDYAVNGPGINISLDVMFNPLIAIDGTTPVPAMAQMEGIIGTSGNDTLGGDVSAIALAEGLPVHIENNWLIGGSGNDTITGSFGNDLIIGGSVRLDQLIGQYADAANASGPGNLVIGSAEWIADAMRTGSSGYTGTNDGYDNDAEDSYTGSANQATGALSGGFLVAANATIAGTANDFELHFTDMLKSRMFKDVVLGDGNVTQDTGTSDAATFSGKLADYTVTQVSGGGLSGFKIVDNRQHDADGFVVDVNGVIQTDANGNEMVHDGTDLVVGIELLKFADQTVSPLFFFDAPPAVDLNYAPVFSTVTLATDGFINTAGQGNPPTPNYARGTGWATNWVETNDGANASNNGQIQVAGGGNQVLRFGAGTVAGDGNNGAEIVRTVNLSGQSSATVSFSVNEQNFGANETIAVLFAADGTNFTQQLTINSVTDNNGGNAMSFTVNAPTNGFATTAAIKFVVSGVAAVAGFGAHTVSVDNITVTTPGPITDGAAGVNFSTLYAEGNNTTGLGTAVNITALPNAPAGSTGPVITDTDNANMASAKIVIREKVAGDALHVGDLTGLGITATGNGTGTNGLVGATVVTLAGNSSKANYQAALQLITFDNNSLDPTNHGNNPNRHIDVTVNDGFKESPVATTTVNITAIDNAATALVADTVITNIGGNANPGGNLTITIPDWALVANDIDPDGAVISGVSTAVSLNNLGHNNGNVTLRDVISANPLQPAGGTFNYSSGALTTTVTVTQDTQGALDGTAVDDIIIGNGNGSIINALAGADKILANGGDDTVNAGDGNDIIHGGAGNDIINAGADDDTIVWNAGGGGGDGTDVIDGGASTAGIGDTFVINGNNGVETYEVLSVTDPANAARIDELLNLANNGDGYVLVNPLVEILVVRITNNGNNYEIVAELDNIEELVINTQLVSSGGGNTSGQGADTVRIIGDFSGTSLALNTIHINGGRGDDTVDISRLTSDHRIVFNSDGGNDRVIGALRAQDVVNVANLVSSVGVEAHTYHDVIGTAGRDNLRGDYVDDRIDARNGNDAAWGGFGNDKFVSSTGDGNDRYYGEDGDDLFVASVNDGRDLYHGGVGSDTLDMSAISANISANLAYNFVKVNGVTDILRSVENIVTGSGSDTVIASKDQNTIDTGAGADRIVFKSAAQADDDTIVSFDTGDIIDVSAMMGGHLTLVQGGAATAASHIAWEYDDSTNVTELHGIDAHGNHFDIDIKGKHQMNASDFAV